MTAKEREDKTKDTENRRKALEQAQIDLEKRFGKGSIMKLGQEAHNVKAISTGLPSLDKVLGVGGFPIGRVIEIFGLEMSGKTTIALQMISAIQRDGGIAAFVDAEHALDPAYARALGVDTNELWLSQPTSGEEALEIVETLVRSGGPGIVVIDSVAALTPQAEIDGDMGDSVTGDTPVFIKKNGMFDIVPIEDLWGGGSIPEGRNTARYAKFKGRNREGIQILTHKGWSDIQAVFLKKNYKNKKIVATRTAIGLAKTTPDHSLFMHGVEKKPSEIVIGDILDTVGFNGGFEDGSRNTLLPEVAWLLGYFVAVRLIDILDKQERNFNIL